MFYFRRIAADCLLGISERMGGAERKIVHLPRFCEWEGGSGGRIPRLADTIFSKICSIGDESEKHSTCFLVYSVHASHGFSPLTVVSLLFLTAEPQSQDSPSIGVCTC